MTGPDGAPPGGGGSDPTFDRVMAVVDAALDRPAGTRAAFLEEACGGDDGLLRRARSLLASAEAPDDGMERRLSSAVRAAASAAVAGAHPERIGRYTVIRVLGEGGMGTVYAAHQEEPVQRDVAIKVIRPGLHAPGLIARFRAERQALASLQHPNIAELYEAGTTDDGLPYFAMEWIHGEPITTFCERRSLDLPGRIRLFRTLLGAVQHAHQKTLVHRDLKPSNVLVAEVDGRPVLKVIDFGVARVATGDAGLTGPTGAGQGIGTLEYISPECLLRHGHRADTRSDIYSLGVLLYELVAGAHPFGRDRFNEATPSELERMLLEEPVPAATRRRPPRRAHRDLDRIIDVAMAREPSERYATVVELDADLGRFLESRPISARPPRWRYRAARFLSRNRVPVTAAAVALLLLLGTASHFTLRLADERDRATREAATAQQVTGLLLDVFRQSDPDASRGRDVSARELLERGAEQIERDLGDRPELLAEMSTVIGSVFRSLGLFDHARPQLERALALRAGSFGERSPETAETTLELVWLFHDLGEYDRAETLARRALDIETALGRDSAAAAARHAIGSLLGRKGDYAGEEAWFRENLAARRALFGDHHEEVAQTLNGLGGTLLAQGRHHEAVASYRAALDIRLALYGQDHREVATGYANLGAALRLMGQHAAAEEAARLSLDIRTRVLGAEHPHTTTSLNNLGVLMLDQDRLDDAEPYLRQALRIRRDVLGPDHPQTGVPLYALATLLRRRGDFEEAEPLFRESLALHRATLEPGHANIAHPLIGTAMNLAADGRNTEAESYLREAVSIRETAIGDDHWLTYTAREQLGINQSRLGRVQEADALLVDAYRGLLEAFGHADNRTASARAHLIEHYRTSGRPELADSLSTAELPDIRDRSVDGDT